MFEHGSEEAQASTTNHLFQIVGGHGHNSWLGIYICGWKKNWRDMRKEDLVRLKIDSMVNTKCGRQGEKKIKLLVIKCVLIELNRIKDVP